MCDDWLADLIYISDTDTRRKLGGHERKVSSGGLSAFVRYGYGTGCLSHLDARCMLDDALAFEMIYMQG